MSIARKEVMFQGIFLFIGGEKLPNPGISNELRNYHRKNLISWNSSPLRAGEFLWSLWGFHYMAVFVCLTLYYTILLLKINGFFFHSAQNRLILFRVRASHNAQ